MERLYLAGRPLGILCFLIMMAQLFLYCNTSNTEAVSQEAMKAGEPIKDTDGRVYPTIRIGRQTWMAENLQKTNIPCLENKQALFADGLEQGPDVKFYDGTLRYAYYNNDPTLGWGVIYNFAVIQHCQICPPGYKIPSKADWEALVQELEGMSVAAPKLLKNGSSGFNADLYGRIDSYGSVLGGKCGFWWSSDLQIVDSDKPEAFTFEIAHPGFIKIKRQDIRSGNYVRCIKSK